MPDLRLRYPDLSQSQRKAIGLLIEDLTKRHDLSEGAKRDLIEDRLTDYRERNAERSAVRSDLAERAEQVRIDSTRARQFERFDTEVRRGRAKPPVVVLNPGATPGYWLGYCLDCERELWVHRPTPRVPVCGRCRGSREARRVA